MEYADSSLEKDLEIKSRIYAEVEMAEYWVINRKPRELAGLRQPQAGEYADRTTDTADDMAPLAFPDRSIAVSRLVH